MPVLPPLLLVAPAPGLLPELEAAPTLLPGITLLGPAEHAPIAIEEIRERTARPIRPHVAR
jgi:hypothetical protein